MPAEIQTPVAVVTATPQPTQPTPAPAAPAPAATQPAAVTIIPEPAEPQKIRAVYGDMVDLYTGRLYTAVPREHTEPSLWVDSQLAAGKLQLE